MSLLLRRLAPAVLAIVVLVALAAPVSAHAVLLATTPADREVLDSAPSEVRLEFNEAISISPGAVVVIDPRGDELGGVEAGAVDTDLVATLPELDVDGSYTVGWRVISADGHPVTGAFLFHLRDETLLEPVAVDFEGASVVADVVRAIGIVAALLGSIAVALSLVRRRTRAWPEWCLVVAGALLVVVGSVVGVGGSPSDAFSVVLDTTMGSVAVAAVLVALAGLVVALTVPWWPAQAALVVVVVTLVALSGHAVSLAPVALSAPLTVAHALAAVVWLVVLLRLVLALGDAAGGERARTAATATTPWALASVVVLAGTGGWLVLDRVPTSELLGSGYGQLSLLKAGLLGIAVVLAALNRFRFAPRLVEAGAATAALTSLRRSVRVEVVVVVLALVAGAAVAQVAPPGAGAPELLIDRTGFGEGEVELSVEPLRRGTNEVHVIALGDDGRLMADLEDLRVEMYLPDRDLGPLEPEIQPVTGGHVLSFADVPLAGDWEFVVLARIGRFEELRATFEVPIGNRD